MERIFRGVFGCLALFFLMVSYFGYNQGFLDFLAPFFLVVVFSSILIYNFSNWQQFLLICVAWTLGIYSISNIFTNDSSLSVSGINIATWYAFYPSIFILYKIIKKVNDKNWIRTSIAAMDTFVIFGIIFLLISGINGIHRASFTTGLIQDWREFYVYSVAMLIYITSVREKYKIDAKQKWNKYWKYLSSIAAFIAGITIISISTYSLLIPKNINFLTFLLESFLGIAVLFITYTISKKSDKDTTSQRDQ